MALAEYDARSKSTAELRVKHIVSVADSSNQFEAYLTATLGGATNSDIAAREMLRSDDFRAHSDGVRADALSMPKRHRKADQGHPERKRRERRLGERPYEYEPIIGQDGQIRRADEYERIALDDLSDDSDSASDGPRVLSRTKKGKQDANFWQPA